MSSPSLCRLDGAPEAFGSGGHFDVADAERRERVDQGVGNGGEGADIAGLAGTLDPERVGLGRHGVAVAMDGRQIARPRHRVIHERPGEKLARSRVETDVFYEDLADTLRDAAADLALEQQWVQYRADIVDDAVAQDFDLAGLRID